MTRQESIESAFARVNARNISHDALVTPSLTTATSLTDTSSEPTDVSERPESPVRNHARSRAGVGSSKEEVTPPQMASIATSQSLKEESHALPDQSPIEESKECSREQLLRQSMQALDEGWDIGAMPGDDIDIPAKHGEEVKRRKSTRLDILDHAANVVDRTTSVLGKRGREVIEAGMEKLQSLKGGRKRPSMRLSKAETSSFESPKKRARFAGAYNDVNISHQGSVKANSARKRSKHWVNQGLYIGQHPGFDPKLTETKNKLKKSSTKHQKSPKTSAMPLPMFAGERTLSVGRDFKLPFDVFSPLPPGQPKPDEWKKTHKNIFIGDAGDFWKKAKPQEHSLCICHRDTGCDEHCLNRFMLYECDDTNCNIGAEHCTNRAFADLKKRCKKGDKYNVGVEVTKTLDRGYGVRANRTFEPNQIIIEYTGEIITQDECDRRMNTCYKDAECYYLMDFDQSMVLDATRGSIARFINHSCAPNCRMIKWTVSGKPRMALFAGDDGIMTGEELTYDYNFDPFSAKNVQECRCGAQGCRGILGPKPKEIKEALKPILANKKRKIQQVVEDAVETVTKKRKIAVPSSVKSALATAKAQTSRRLSQASILDLSNRREKTEDAESERPQKRLKRKSTTGFLKDEKKSKDPQSKEPRRRSTGDTLPRGWKGWALVDTPPETPVAGPPPEEGGSKWESLGAPANINENVVQTVRRSNRGTPGKTIRVIALGEDELKDWR